jgi:hypothetical protein
MAQYSQAFWQLLISVTGAMDEIAKVAVADGSRLSEQLLLCLAA